MRNEKPTSGFMNLFGQLFEQNTIFVVLIAYNNEKMGKK
jgi:hypothetical protein